MNLWSVTLLLELLNKLWILCFLIYLSHLCYFNERLYFGRLTHWFLLEAVQGFRVRYKQFLRSYLTPLSGTTRHLIFFIYFFLFFIFFSKSKTHGNICDSDLSCCSI